MTKSHKKPHKRDDLTGEYFAGDAGQIIIAILFAAIWISDSFFLEYTTFLNQYIPTAVKIPVGLIFLIISGYFSFTGLFIVFLEKREKPSVIKKGVFKFVRHPIYLGEILLYFGLLILNTSLAALIIWIIGMFFFHYISKYEESLLIARFGEEYVQYKKEVPMWIPRFFKR